MADPTQKNKIIRDISPDNLTNTSLSTSHDKITSYISIVSFLSLFVSVLYNYTYFTYVGVDLFNILSPIDYIKSAIKIAPFFLILVISQTIAVIFIKTKRGVKSFVPMFKSRRKRIPIFIIINFILTITTLFMLIVRDDMTSRQIVILLGIFCIQIAGILVIVLMEFNALPEMSFYTVSSIVTIISVTLISPIVGIGSAKSDMEDIKSNYIIHNSMNGSAPLSVRILRFTEKGILFRDMNNRKIAFIPWDDVKIVQKSEDNDFNSVIVDASEKYISNIRLFQLHVIKRLNFHIGGGDVKQ